jgi:hypothetical protein
MSFWSDLVNRFPRSAYQRNRLVWGRTFVNRRELPSFRAGGLGASTCARHVRQAEHPHGLLPLPDLDVGKIDAQNLLSGKVKAIGMRLPPAAQPSSRSRQ